MLFMLMMKTMMLTMILVTTDPSHVRSFQKLFRSDRNVVEEAEAHRLQYDADYAGDGDDDNDDHDHDDRDDAIGGDNVNANGGDKETTELLF